MTSLALPAALHRPGPWDEALRRQPVLARFGAALILLTSVALLLQLVDQRTLASGANIWVKPAKFLFSTGLFALTAAWFFGYMREERRGSRTMRVTVAVLVASTVLELAYILFQAAQAGESHFNLSSPFTAIMYALMGLFALLLIGTTLPMAWEIARRPAPGLERDFTAAVAIGLVLTFLLGAGLGFYMSSQPGHAVGAVGGQVPVFGWNRSGGDLRVAHFLAIHAQQAIPLLAAGLAGLGLPPPARRLALAAGTVAYIALTLGVFAGAVAGRPLLPL